MKIFIKILKALGVGVVAVVFVTIGINAADNYDNISQSIVGRLILGKDKGPCPEDMVYVSKENGGFCIDRYEASPSHDCPHQDPLSQVDTTVNLDYQGCKAEAKKGVAPWRNISQDQARTACAKAQKHLATSQEWLQAALGTPDKESGWAAEDCQVDNNWDAQPGLAGSGQNCVSSFGAFDMIGNAWEWVDGAALDGIYNGHALPEQGYIDSLDGESLPAATNADTPNVNYHNDYFWIKNNGARGVVRGGYWNNKNDAGQYSAYVVAPPSSTENGIGFRCAK